MLSLYLLVANLSSPIVQEIVNWVTTTDGCVESRRRCVLDLSQTTQHCASPNDFPVGRESHKDIGIGTL